LLRGGECNDPYLSIPVLSLSRPFLASSLVPSFSFSCLLSLFLLCVSDSLSVRIDSSVSCVPLGKRQSVSELRFCLRASLACFSLASSLSSNLSRLPLVPTLGCTLVRTCLVSSCLVSFQAVACSAKPSLARSCLRRALIVSVVSNRCFQGLGLLSRLEVIEALVVVVVSFSFLSCRLVVSLLSLFFFLPVPFPV
jgi:hypothetical protein